MMDLIEDFTRALFRCLTRSDSTMRGGIIKKHTENFETHGEVSFCVDIAPWRHYIEEETQYNNILHFAFYHQIKKCEQDVYQSLGEASQSWTLKIAKCNVAHGRVYVFLDRTHAIGQYLKRQLQNEENFTFNQTISSVSITQDPYNLDDLTCCRLKYLIDVSKNLLHTVGYKILNSDSSQDCDCTRIHFTMKSAKKSSKECVNIFSAPVLNDKTGIKETELSTMDYLGKRIMDMQLIAQHKYGLRVKDEEKWKMFVEQIGEAAVIFDLLQNKPSHPVSISSVDGVSGCSKGVAFVLYNCARLSAIVKKYDESVQSGLYPHLSSIEEVDFSLLNDSDEWILMFNFMMGYPSLLKKCVNLSSKDSSISPHLLCTYLSNLSGRFSMYYRRIRILLEPRKHLLPMVEARIHFVLALQRILHHGLKLLNITPVTQM